MARERVVDVYIPVIAPSASGLGGVGAIFAVAAGVVVVAVLVMVAVVLTHPEPQHRYYDQPCGAFCPVSTSAAPVPPAEFPFGGAR
ncbi:hypothetical protein BJY24_007888 [Nocardia transvalensis]|uniref:Uncharacterized protein n=1 Tax=Nocardia transvalensis TaxID=37333 RepID=A0A7W9PN17_9NOCA|nr:hypothetical protein [Nocardia transvalensis]MBB5918955.1 hypothetical protein [Nocardia transvalensis]